MDLTKKYFSYQVGKDLVKVSLLQFADDSFFFPKASMSNFICLKSILRCFELAFGLEVNFLKRKLVVLVWMKALYIGMPPYLIVK